MYSGKQLDFKWKEAGISLHFPTATCDKDINVSIKVMNNVEQSCIAPKGYQLMPMASKTFKITESAPLPCPVTVRMEHCTTVYEENTLVFMMARGGPPYRFKAVSDGHFPLKKSYGEVKIVKFCLLTTFYNIVDKNKSLAIYVAYLKSNSVHFVVIKNIPDHCDAVRDKYKDATLHSCIMTYFYFTTKISLSVNDSNEDNDGWQIKSTCKPPQIQMRNIHDFIPGCEIPKIELKMKWQGRGEPQEKDIEIGIEGGSMKSFTLSCKPAQQSQLLTPPFEQSAIPHTSPSLGESLTTQPSQSGPG